MAGMPWSLEQIEYVKSNFETMKCREMAAVLGRSTKAVQHLFNKLGLERSEPQIGDVLWRLKILELVNEFQYGQNITYAICECQCINRTAVIAKLSSIKRGDTKSCGCWRAEKASETCTKKNFIHGKCGTPLHDVWLGMVSRCYYPTCGGYENYGGRGIYICDLWYPKEQYMNFDNWGMNNGYQPGLTIERMDNNGPYSPENCKWATYTEQANNRRNNILVTAWGETKTATEWSKDNRSQAKTGNTIIWRINNGWEIEEAIIKPTYN